MHEWVYRMYTLFSSNGSGGPRARLGMGIFVNECVLELCIHRLCETPRASFW